MSCSTKPIWPRKSSQELVVAHVDPVDQDAAGGRVVEARNQAHDGRFAAAGRADDARPSGPARSRSLTSVSTGAVGS